MLQASCEDLSRKANPAVSKGEAAEAGACPKRAYAVRGAAPPRAVQSEFVEHGSKEPKDGTKVLQASKCQLDKACDVVYRAFLRMHRTCARSCGPSHLPRISSFSGWQRRPRPCSPSLTWSSHATSSLTQTATNEETLQHYLLEDNPSAHCFQGVVFQDVIQL